MTLELVYINSAEFINDLIRREYILQGHELTGTFARSLKSNINPKTGILTTTAVDYARIVDEGLGPSDVSPKMIPGLVRYFILRGYTEEAAKKFAVMTFAKWKKEGMSTQASKRFSQTGARHNFIEAAFTNADIDQKVGQNFDLMVDSLYKKVSSETI